MSRLLSSVRPALRDRLAALSRRLPPLRGRGRVGNALGRLLTDFDSDEASIVTFRMQDGSLMRADLRSPMEQNAFWTGEYDGGVIRRLTTCLRRGSVVLDVGANVGFFALAFGWRLRALGGGRVYAFEPVSENFERLSRVIALNRLGDVIEPLRLALGDEEGTIRLQVETTRARTGNAIMVVGESEAGGELAPITRLDRLARERPIDACHLVKVDIEGAEHLFLRGGAEFLRAHRPIIYGEFGPHLMSRFGHSLTDVAALCGQWGYRFYRQEGIDRFLPMPEPQPGTENVLLLPRGTPRATLDGLGVYLP